MRMRLGQGQTLLGRKDPAPSVRLPERHPDADPALSARFSAAFPGVRTRALGPAAPGAGGSRASTGRQRRGRLCTGRAAPLPREALGARAAAPRSRPAAAAAPRSPAARGNVGKHKIIEEEHSPGLPEPSPCPKGGSCPEAGAARKDAAALSQEPRTKLTFPEWLQFPGCGERRSLPEWGKCPCWLLCPQWAENADLGKMGLTGKITELISSLPKALVFEQPNPARPPPPPVLLMVWMLELPLWMC
ncbi:uncharacterized protein LOC125327875 [Corvus hawaiiensis]|uniref:uncharacterized protein LOC125327875 n=1 Tax=Corvus hawaiiensis TaxID=134902 RepID=UPI002019DAD7|nr:uncharacterized protein LOC125327875 [Corvus hawaiiensis]XP_048163852.1 uncharacterized protein LOC125327875 [Corvus hawaiiensis]